MPLIITIFFIGCSTSVKVKVMRYTTEVFQPTHKIEVLHTAPIGREYIEIGEISIRVNKSTEENAIVYLNQKAKELGANAIVLMGERSKGTLMAPVGRNGFWAVPIRELYAIAIKYQ